MRAPAYSLGGTVSFKLTLQHFATYVAYRSCRRGASRTLATDQSTSLQISEAWHLDPGHYLEDQVLSSACSIYGLMFSKEKLLEICLVLGNGYALTTFPC